MRHLQKWIAVVVALTLSAQLWAANTKRTVTQVTEMKELTEDVDFIISSATPFTNDGVVNIVNTEHAVLILENVKPSKAIPMLAAHVQINGAKAVNISNCQVKIYNRGSIILPYGNSTKPLTVYSEKNYGGESANNFDLRNDGGFMNTLTDAQLNNRIRSFKLKRGYMVTFSIKARGRGYSRCFIAADKDLEMATMPAILDRSISSYRIFKWYDTGKQQLAAAGGDNNACSALNVTSTYTWGTTSDMSPDVENVPHHIYENYPSPASLGACTTSPHMKTNNEPMNTADDPKGKTESVEDILANWEDLMATGMRLCSPSSWDGSDYTNGTGFLKRFCDEIDARGWRCDIIDLHCYWPESNFGTISNWTSSTGRPVWISEWVWGASWNSNGAFASNVTEAQNAEALKRICPVLNNNANIERYYYWNGERDPSRLYKDGSLTAAGKYYASINSGLGFKGKQYVPKAPPQVAPTNLDIKYDAEKGTATLTWKESNGEMNDYIYVQCRHSSKESWTNVTEVPFYEDTDIYTVSDIEAKEGWEFRINEKNANGGIQISNTVMVVNSSIKPGDAVSVGDKTLYIGGNVITNGDFDMGLYGWTNGKGEALTQPWFQVPAIGGVDNSPYLQCYGNGTTSVEQSVKTAFKIEPNADYYFIADACNMTTSSIANAILSSNGTNTNGGRVVTLSNTSEAWLSTFNTFNSGSNEYVIIAFYTLGAKARFDGIRLYRLFDTKEEAYADAAAKEREHAQAILDYAPQFESALTAGLSQTMEDKQADYTYVKKLTDDAVLASSIIPVLKERAAMAKAIVAEYPIIGSEEIGEIVAEAESVLTDQIDPERVIELYEALEEQLEQSLTTTTVEGKVKSPNFTSATGWKTKTGTFTDGDQRLATQDGVTCWNAWWSLAPAEADGMTMAIEQDITGLQSHGLYFAECKASTQHYCLSDQQAFIKMGGTTVFSPMLSKDFLDLTNISVDDRWETLTTLPVYVDYNQGVTIGFQSSKNGVIDQAYRAVGASNATGDHREGWWCATDFTLRHLPFYQTYVAAGEWQTACLPYNVAATPKMKFYQIAGILSDFSALCLEEVQEVEAGDPFLYVSEESTAKFREYGEAVKSAESYGKGNLRGFFTTTARVPVGAYSIINGQFVKITGDRPSIGNYHAFMRSFTDPSNKDTYTLYDTWSGATIPITGITDEEKEALTMNSIVQVEANNRQSSSLYTSSGIPVRENTVQPGIYIKVKNGKATKIIIR